MLGRSLDCSAAMMAAKYLGHAFFFSGNVFANPTASSSAPYPDTVAKLIEKFESHQHKEQFLKDMSQTQKICRFSEASLPHCQYQKWHSSSSSSTSWWQWTEHWWSSKIHQNQQLPLSLWNEQHQRTGRPVEDAYSSSYSEWNVD